MKSPTPQHRLKRGSALLTILFLMGIMALLTGTMLTYSASERRGNERNRLILRAKNMAENIALYSAEQLTTKLYRLGSTPVGRFPTAVSGTTGGSSTEIHTPPSDVLTADCTAFEMKVAIEEASPYALVNDPTSPNNGLQVGIAKVPIIAKATATNAALGSVTAYVQQDMELALTPLFQFGMFYNMDMELYPSQDFTVAGPVHTNYRLMVHPDGSAQKTILFQDRVTCADHLIADQSLKARPRGASGSFNDPVLADGQVIFTSTTAVQTSLKDNTSMTTGAWRDHRWKTTDYPPTASEIANFKTWATTTYNGNLRTSAHGVTKLELPGIGSYKETNDPATPEDDRNNGRQIIESPDQKRWNNSSSTFAWTTDTAALKTTKISWRAGLYIMVNPDNDFRSGKLPDGTIITLLPYTYRCWLNETNTDGTHTCTEIVLPGQPSYGYNAGPDGVVGTVDDYMYRNNLPNAYTNYTSVGNNQVLRIPQQAYSTGNAYITNGTTYNVNDTSLTLTTNANTVLGTILDGDTVTIGAYKYIVRTALSSTNVLVLASPGLRATVSPATPVYVDPPVGAATNGTGYTASAAVAVNATSIPLTGGTGQILAGNTIVVGTQKYLVISALEAGAVTIASPGVRTAITSGTAVTVDPFSGTRGTGNRYQINNGAGYAAGIQTLAVDTGTGTIIPGNTITIGGYVYTVASVNGTAPTSISITPGLSALVADNAVITLNPAVTNGYAHNFGTGSGYLLNGAQAVGATDLVVDTGTGTVYPGDALSIGSQKYFVSSASPVGGPVTSIKLLSPGLVAAATDNTAVTLESAAGGSTFPADASTTPYAMQEAYFYDMRRANGNGALGTAGSSSDFGRSTTAYVPRPIAKIDFDMAKFKMMVNRAEYGLLTSTGYYVQAPTAGNFANSIYNSAGTTTALGLGMGAGYNIFPGAASVAEKTRQDPFQIYIAPANPEANATQDAILSAGADPRVYAITAASLANAWYDGLAIYIHSVDAEQRSQTSGIADRIDSGVRLWNGRGPVATFTSVGNTGCTFCTNDAVYIIGHYNADGTINSTATDSGTAATIDGVATFVGGFSARYGDSVNERLCSVMGDAVTIVSQPTYTLSGGVYSQTNGWCDAYSALPVVASSSGWSTSAAGSDDGVYNPTNIQPGLLPTNNSPGGFGATSNIKLGAVSTEVSTALLVGIVPSNHSPTGLTDRAPNTGANNVNSGGANNFPRLLDNWSGDSLYIRGSMVALFESRVAMEPFTQSRCYRAPGRYWGLHQGFRTPNHDVPLEPIVLSATRMGFRELSAAEYNTKKTEINAMTVIP